MSLAGRYEYTLYFCMLSLVQNNGYCFIQVGKWNGNPIYKTLDKDVFINPILSEYYCHAPYWEFYKKAMEEQIQV